MRPEGRPEMGQRGAAWRLGPTRAPRQVSYPRRASPAPPPAAHPPVEAALLDAEPGLALLRLLAHGLLVLHWLRGCGRWLRGRWGPERGAGVELGGRRDAEGPGGVAL